VNTTEQTLYVLSSVVFFFVGQSISKMSTFVSEIVQMTIEERIRAFSELGAELRSFISGRGTTLSSEFENLISRQQYLNPWFTPSNVVHAISAIAEELTEKNLHSWTGAYPGLGEDHEPLNAGLIMAGNIPLVGFHDFLSVLISGNRVLAKTSSRDSELIRKIADLLCSIDGRFSGMIEFTEENLKGFDLIIATGSNNSSRYFEYYFGRYPNIIRKNRNSIAILDGSETAAELEALGSDIFLYFGLGCRNVSKIYIPEGSNPTILFPHWQQYSPLVHHSKYANNYDYNKAIYLVNREPFLDTGYLLVKEDKKLSSPVSVLFFEYYGSQGSLNDEIGILKDQIQCITGHGFLPFGKAQTPLLWDYADGIDTLEFLSKKNSAVIL